MPSRTSAEKSPAPAPTVPVNVPSVIVPPAPVQAAPVQAAPAAPAKVDPLPDAVRAFLVCVPRDIAGLPGLTPETYAKYLAARDAVEKALAER